MIIFEIFNQKAALKLSETKGKPFQLHRAVQFVFNHSSDN